MGQICQLFLNDSARDALVLMKVGAKTSSVASMRARAACARAVFRVDHVIPTWRRNCRFEQQVGSN